MQKPVPQVENYIYQRFLKVPAKISHILAIVLFLSLVELGGLVNGWVGAVIATPIAVAASIILAAISLHIMKKERIHSWLKHKFTAWPDALAWIDKTPAIEVNRLAAMSDEEWNQYELKT